MNRDDIARFLSAKNARATCPSCDKNDWVIPDDENSFTQTITTGDNLIIPEEKLAVTVLKTILMVCNNCGFIRQHSKIFIEDFLKGAPGANGGRSN